MGFLTPAALLFGLLAAPVIALYLLRLRRRERRVSSTFLWRQTLRDLEANVPWQRLRPNLLLFLQLLVLAALVLALARPYLSRASQVDGDLFLLLDASASMTATDVAPSRFGAAQEKAAELVDQVPPGNVATVILMGDAPELLVAQSADRAVLHDAIRTARPGSSGAALDAALSLAASLTVEGRPAEVVVLSDGGVSSSTALGPLPFNLRHERIGVSGDNVAIAAFSSRATADGVEALARVANYGPSPTQVTLHLSLDGTLFDVRTLSLPAETEIVERWAGLPDTTVLEAGLEPGDDFAADDRAWALGSQSGQARVLLVTEGNRFLAKALELQPALEVTIAGPAAYSAAGNYDLWVFDGYLPETLPNGTLLVFDPPPGSAPWAGIESGPVAGLRQRDDDLLRYVDLSDLHLLDTAPLRPPPDAHVLLDSSGGPLAAAWQEEGRRIVAFAFDLHESDLPLQPTFPILVQNVVGWLLPGVGQGVATQPGQTIEVPVSPDVDEAWVENPAGERVQVVPPHPPAPFEVEEPGLYRVIQQAGDREQVAFFTANLFSPDESTVAPAVLPALDAQAGSGSRRTASLWELAPWLALAALIVLGAEWWVFNRGR